MKNGRARSVRRWFSMLCVAALAGLGFAAGASAHDEIASSVPADRSQLDEPISEVTIEFGEPVDGVELALVDPDNNDIPGQVFKLSDTSARLEFELLSQEGQYIVRYLAEEDGHLVAGAISFVYGSEGGSGASSATWIIFGLVAALILAIGGYFSLRRSNRLDDGLVSADEA